MVDSLTVELTEAKPGDDAPWNDPSSPRFTGAAPEPEATQFTEFRLTLADSKGPHEGREADTGAPCETGQICPGCEEIPLRGDSIVKLWGAWWHAEHAARQLREGGVDEAWIALGQSLAARPSFFGVAETRAIARNLLRIAGADSVAAAAEWRTQ
jgi:hypothetical protein